MARDVGLDLGIIDAVSDLSSEDLEDLKAISRRKHAEWKKSRKFCYWDEDDIPDEVYEPLRACLVAFAGKSFGKSIRDEPMSEEQTRLSREARLAAIAGTKYTGAVAKGEYY